MHRTRKKRKQSHLVEEDALPSSSNMVNKDLIDEEACLSLFERIYSGMVVPKMPSIAWAIHSSPLPVRRIVASELRVCGENVIDVAPLYIKQIIFDQNLNFEVFFVNTKTVLKDKPSNPQSMEEFECIITYINGIKICAGGPGIGEYCNVNPECAYKDPMDKWRHNLCSLETVGETVCKSCFSLHEILQRHVQRNKPPAKAMLKSRKKRKVGLRHSKHI